VKETSFSGKTGATQGCQIFLDAMYQKGGGNIFHFQAHQNLPKFEFLVSKFTIWHPWCFTLLSTSDLPTVKMSTSLIAPQ
jgi:hypothetical protein